MLCFEILASCRAAQQEHDKDPMGNETGDDDEGDLVYVCFGCGCFGVRWLVFVVLVLCSCMFA